MSTDELPDPTINGAAFILDQPAEVSAIWGEGSRVLWAPGEALMIAGPQGVGKTTLAGLIVKALLGIIAEVLGLPVAEFRGLILYLAMDRPRQISRSLRRQFNEEHRQTLADRLIVRPGPPLADLAVNPTLLASMAQQYGAAVLVVDSLKDAVVGLSEDAVAASYNRARQHLLTSGCELIELHHVVKRSSKNDQPGSAVDSIYGSTWLTSGCGSIVVISGEPGDPIVGFRHVKQPAEEVGPYQLLHDQDAGLLTIEYGLDLAQLVKAAGPDGLTAKDAAAAITEKTQPGKPEIEKARRKLDKLVTAGVLVRMEGGPRRRRYSHPGGMVPSCQPQSRAITHGGKPAGQQQSRTIHGFGHSRRNHANHTKRQYERSAQSRGQSRQSRARQSRFARTF